MLAKNSRLCMQLSASACKIASVWLCHPKQRSKVPAHFPNQISKGHQLNSQKHGRGCGLANAKKIKLWCKDAILPTSCLLVSCLVTEWPPRQSHANCSQLVAYKLFPRGRQNLRRHMCLLRPIQLHYAWPDPISWDSSFNLPVMMFKPLGLLHCLFSVIF